MFTDIQIQTIYTIMKYVLIVDQLEGHIHAVPYTTNIKVIHSVKVYIPKCHHIAFIKKLATEYQLSNDQNNENMQIIESHSFKSSMAIQHAHIKERKIRHVSFIIRSIESRSTLPLAICIQR